PQVGGGIAGAGRAWESHPIGLVRGETGRSTCRGPPPVAGSVIERAGAAGAGCERPALPGRVVSGPVLPGRGVSEMHAPRGEAADLGRPPAAAVPRVGVPARRFADAAETSRRRTPPQPAHLFRAVVPAAQ